MMAENAVAKLVLVDDHQIIIDGLKSLLEDLPAYKVIGEASNGKEALNLLDLIETDIVLMDVDMPVLNGIEATKKIKEKNSNVKVIILSMHKESGLIKTMIKAGADGYLVKNSDREELIKALEAVRNGNKYFSSDVTLSLLDNKDTDFTNPDGKKIAELTSREIEILKLVAEGLSNKEIGELLFISHRTVDTHRTNLMKKLEVSNIAGLIRFAIHQGFVEP